MKQIEFAFRKIRQTIFTGAQVHQWVLIDQVRSGWTPFDPYFRLIRTSRWELLSSEFLLKKTFRRVLPSILSLSSSRLLSIFIFWQKNICRFRRRLQFPSIRKIYILFSGIYDARLPHYASRISRFVKCKRVCKAPQAKFFKYRRADEFWRDNCFLYSWFLRWQISMAV